MLNTSPLGDDPFFHCVDKELENPKSVVILLGLMFFFVTNLH